MNFKILICYFRDITYFYTYLFCPGHCSYHVRASNVSLIPTPDILSQNVMQKNRKITISKIPDRYMQSIGRISSFDFKI